MTLMLEGAVDDRDLIIAGLREQLRQANEALTTERSKNAQVDKGMQSLRKILSPLHGALGAVFGELDEMGVDESPMGSESTFSGSPKANAVWDSWKQKLPGIPAKFIDALLLHGALTQTQLRLHAQCAKGSVASAVSQLHRAGLINKNNGKISLKEAA